MKVKLTFILLFFCVFGFAQVKTIGQKKLYFGVAYYPELWDENLIDSDIERMKELNINVVRMGEFAWSKMEPSEGVYDFEWLRHIIQKLHKNNIDVILGTPTATPPAWLWTKYPEIGRVDEDGYLLGRGGRRDVKYTSSIYNQKCKQIAAKMAQEFGKQPGVIAWQIDNEFKLDYDYSAETRVLWQQWLLTKYQTISQLNSKWGANLWSQNYDSFAEVPMPNKRVWYSPSLKFDWALFTNQQIYNFELLQIEAIKAYSALPITHDQMPGQPVDYEKLAEIEDFSAINIYHNYKVYDRILSNYDRLRTLSKRMYWLFETSPNYAGGGEKGITWFTHEPDKSVKAFMWANYALGGQGAMFWLWRQQWAGQEMTHGSVISAWGKPAANYQDIKDLGQEISKASTFLLENPVMPAKVGIVYSNLSDIGFGIENYVDGLKYYQEWTAKFYKPLLAAHVPRDVVYPSSNLSGYKMLIVPMMPYLSEEFKDKLESWVKSGGLLILGPMTGYRTANWTSFTDNATGNLERWTGVNTVSRVPAPLNKNNNDLDVHLNWLSIVEKDSTAVSLWADALSSKSGNVLANYSNGMQKYEPAVIENKVGAGKVIVLGTNPGISALKKLYLHYGNIQGVKPNLCQSSDVLIVNRGKNGKIAGTVLINYGLKPQNIALPLTKEAVNLLNSSIVNTSQIKLNPFEVMVLKFN
ncbi:MAG TPA: beta-galactosidase [Pelobium sp.]